MAGLEDGYSWSEVDPDLSQPVFRTLVELRTARRFIDRLIDEATMRGLPAARVADLRHALVAIDAIEQARPR